MEFARAVRGEGGGAATLRRLFTESEVAALLAALCPVSTATRRRRVANGTGEGVQEHDEESPVSADDTTGDSVDDEGDQLRPLDVFTEGNEWRLPA